MANFFENRDRRVIPNWRTFKKTVLLGELNSNWIDAREGDILLSIDGYISDWSENKSVPIASDLLSASVSNNQRNRHEVLEAANFILQHPDSTTISQQSLAHRLVSSLPPSKVSRKIETLTAEDLGGLINPNPLKRKIQILKKNLGYFPLNPILYVELSRLYSILGQEDKAKRAMLSALHLGSRNRFVLRSAARLFAHYDDLDYAHDILRTSSLVGHDPWITSAEIALATIRDRRSRFLKRGIEMVNSRNFSPFSLSELASSLGTVELLHGTLRKSRELFALSLRDPNDNSLAQAEWAINKDKSLKIDISSFEIEYGFEASAIYNFYNDDYKTALNDAARWLVDMPFSKRPVLLGSHIAGSMLSDHQTAITFTKAGLASHPNDPQLINNIAYSLILLGKIEDADRYLRTLPSIDQINEPASICLTATIGLLHFRRGETEKGRILYRKAIEDARRVNDRYFNWLAILNYAREEILAKSPFVDEVIEAVSRIPDNIESRDIYKLKNEVVALYRQLKS